MSSASVSPPFNGQAPWRARARWTLRRLRSACQVVGLAALVVTFGFKEPPRWTYLPLDLMFWVLAGVLTALPVAEWWLSLAPRTFLRENRVRAVVVLITLTGVTALGWADARPAAWLVWWMLTVLVWVLLGMLTLFRRVSLAGWSPAAVLVLSFLLLIACGMGLLMLPRMHAAGRGADASTALFTSTSAVCVTGLVVVDTGEYWSRTGQVVILMLIQLGGLGIMTFGAFFALMAGRGLVARESLVLGEMLERTGPYHVRRLVLAILTFTLVAEAAGAVALSGLWAHLPPEERLFHSVFHSVSAFCNAGFSPHSDNLEGYAVRWQVLGGVSGLIILGGLGFVTLYNLGELAKWRLTRRPPHPLFRLPKERARLHLATRLVLITTAALLVGGTAGILLLEWDRQFAAMSVPEKVGAAWFQSVTCRTAGFNTVNIGALSEATKFLMVCLMCVGASPGSTGGGIKTVTFAVVLLALRAILRGRDRVEVGYRTISQAQVNRALLMVAMGVGVLVVMTLTVVAVEGSEKYTFMDYLFEVTSALATVGLSTGVTPELSLLSRDVIILGMFLGRIGPLTLLVALAGKSQPEKYSYPEERIILG